ncbi:hypothetical protein K1719_029694 [Acacia pycnantha]|nr:hypothetical protein K1719_029694 [Acacia pycnantha]
MWSCVPYPKRWDVFTSEEFIESRAPATPSNELLTNFSFFLLPDFFLLVDISTSSETEGQQLCALKHHLCHGKDKSVVQCLHVLLTLSQAFQVQDWKNFLICNFLVLGLDFGPEILDSDAIIQDKS